jgi:hypothetical protein
MRGCSCSTGSRQICRQHSRGVKLLLLLTHVVLGGQCWLQAVVAAGPLHRRQPRLHRKGDSFTAYTLDFAPVLHCVVT